MRKDYYVVLGIAPTADLNKIKKAYRTIIKEYHPDTAVDTNSEKFREITEAYKTLTDDEKRKLYDMELMRRQGPTTIKQPGSRYQGRSPYIDDVISAFSRVDDFFEGILPGFFDPGRKTRMVEKDLYVELILSREEALAGGLLPVTIPIIEPCPQCSTSGLQDGFFCPSCFGQGVVRTERQFSLTIPPHTGDGTEVRISLEDIGLTNTYLYITVSIDPTLNFFG